MASARPVWAARKAQAEAGRESKHGALRSNTSLGDWGKDPGLEVAGDEAGKTGKG